MYQIILCNSNLKVAYVGEFIIFFFNEKKVHEFSDGLNRNLHVNVRHLHGTRLGK